MTGVSLPDNFLSDFYLGRCSYDEEFACSAPESKYTDLNIWNSFLSIEDQIGWTTCKLVSLF